MRIQAGQLVALGYGRYVRSDDVVAIEPITDGRGPGRRTFVHVRGVVDPIIGSRAEGPIVDDLVTPAEEASRMRSQRTALRNMMKVLDEASPAVRRVLGEETGADIDSLIVEARGVLG